MSSRTGDVKQESARYMEGFGIEGMEGKGGGKLGQQGEVGSQRAVPWWCWWLNE